MRRTLIPVLVAAAVLRLVISGTTPVVDPTEGRYSEIARNMADTGDWVTPRLWINGEHVPYLGKPPLFFWAAALSIKVFGANEFSVRLPSFVAGAALLLLMYAVLSRYYVPTVAGSATLMTLTSATFFFLSGSVVVDMHLALFVAGSLLAYLAFTLETNPQIQRRWSLLVFLLAAGGFLTKGPVAVVLFGLPVFLWTALRKTWYLLARHAWWRGSSLVAVLVLPWFVLAEIRNPGFLRYFFVNENLMRYFSPDYGDLYGTGHPFPYGSAILMFVAAALPWSLVAAWRFALGRWTVFAEMMSDDVQSFLFLGFAANVAFWCCARQLLLTYMVPIVPMLTTWLAVNLRNDEQALRSGLRLALAACAVWCGVLMAAVPVSSHDSTKAILREAGRVAWELNIPNQVTFASRTSQSAFFYAPDTVLDHRKEGVGTTIQRMLDTGKPRLLITRNAQIHDVPTFLVNRLLQVARSDGWSLYVTRVP
jgi:4-amino-4-deoxy-L-arabinose transferase-like glycosyltransferase